MKRMPHPLTAALVAILLLALLAGCAGRREPVPDNIGYHQLQESFGDRDLTTLEGRRILLDPGHGGYFPGVVGQNGLSEADVNLGVALWLRGLLEAAGAEVHMTRTADTDFLSPADSSLSVDLAARSAMCDTLAPDVFVSLHHNSNAQLDRDMNETQTYYPVGREGADLDLARSIHKHLVRNLEISPAKIMAGNFSVLRNASVPAVLGEPSMLSNPGVERKLSGAQKQRLEAEAYFLGLLEYFEGGNPFWELASDTTDWNGKAITWRFVADSRLPESAPNLDPTSIRLEVNGETKPFLMDIETESVTWDRIKHRANLVYDLSLTARNLAGRSTPESRLDLIKWGYQGHDIRFYPSSSDQDGPFLWVSDDTRFDTRRPYCVFFGDQDADPQYSIDFGKPGSRAGIAHPPENWDGNTLTYMTAEYGGVTRKNTASYIVTIPTMPDLRWHVLMDPDGWQNLPDGEWKIRRHPGTESWNAGLRWVYRRMEIPAFCSIPNHPAWLEIRGARPILIDATHRTPWQAPCDLPRDTLVWQPLVPELVGKTIVIDPHGGAANADGTAPMGTPGRELNLRTAERLAALLRGAGAEAVLTRDDPGFVPPEAKILQANEVDADLFITLRRASPEAPGWSVAHHYGSRGGSSWGALLAQTLARFATPDTVPVTESYAYLLRHTACPAVAVSLPLPSDLDAEETSRSPAYQQSVASALMSATAAWFQGEDLLLSLTDPRTFIIEHTVAPTLLAGCDWIRIDGNWLWLPPRDGTTLPALLPLPGTDHTFEVRRGDRWELLISSVTEGPGPTVWPFWTSEKQPTNPFATTETIDEASGQ